MTANQFVVSQPSQPPAPRNPRAPWAGVTVGRHRFSAGECDNSSAPVYTIDVHLSYPYKLEWKYGKRYRTVNMQAGAMCLAPANEPISLRWDEPVEIIRATLNPNLVAATAECLNLGDDVVILERHGDPDAQIAHLCQVLWTEACSGFSLGRVFGESVGTALASCLLQRYSDTSPTPCAAGKLSPRAWKNLQHFVEEELQNDIRLEDMAQVARLSPYHFARCFKETSGTSPHQYLIARRVERARALLEKGERSLAEIAVLSGFADQSHLTRHMKRILGLTPSALLTYRSARKTIQ